MPRQNKSPDVVTPEYIEAYRRGVLIRTPLENIAFFQAEHKAVVAHTKNNGDFILDIPLWVIGETLKDQTTLVHRSYLVPNDVLPGLKNWRKGNHWVFEIITSIRVGDRVGLCPHTIPVSRRLTQKVRKALEAQSEQ